MFGTVEWYCVITKGKIRFFFLLEEGPNFTIESGLSMNQVVSLSARYV